jgi:CrcB protein
MNVIFIFLGSGLGGVCRWALSSWLNGLHPLGTLLCNVLGCFLLGMITKLSPGDPHMKLLLTTGFCGGFTTFSTFANESFSMMKAGDALQMALYLGASVVIGILAVWLGMNVSDTIK